MPNWCDNELWMYGSKEDLETIEAQVINDKGEFDFGKVIPTPDHPDYNDNEPLNPNSSTWTSEYNWYHWNINNWGTKWNACDTGPVQWYEPEDKDDTYSMQIYYETAWSPSEDVTIALGKQFPNVRFEHKYLELGAGYIGVLTVQDEDVSSWFGEPCHETLTKFGRDCICEVYDDEEDWYDDCKEKENTNA